MSRTCIAGLLVTVLLGTVTVSRAATGPRTKAPEQTGPPTVQKIVAFAIGPRGAVFIANSVDWTVAKYSSSGTWLGQWGGRGVGRGRFSTIDGLAVDQHGRVYVADGVAGRIQVFSSTGTYLWGWNARPAADCLICRPNVVEMWLALTRRGDVIVLQRVAEHRQRQCQCTLEVRRFSSRGKALTRWSWHSVHESTPPPVPGASFSTADPRSLSVDEHDHLLLALNAFVYAGYKSESDFGSIEERTLSGRFLHEVSRGTTHGIFGFFWLAVDGAVSDGAGNIFIAGWDPAADSAEVIERHTETGERLASWSSASCGAGAEGEVMLATDRHHNLYEAARNTGQVVKRSPSGDVLQRWGRCDPNSAGRIPPGGRVSRGPTRLT